jgi:hypothetical protein
MKREIQEGRDNMKPPPPPYLLIVPWCSAKREKKSLSHYGPFQPSKLTKCMSAREQNFRLSLVYRDIWMYVLNMQMIDHFKKKKKGGGRGGRGKQSIPGM